MISKPLASAILIATLSLAPTLARALDIQPYSAAAFSQAQAADKPVALHFHAPWCPTCRAQQKTLQALKSDASLALTVLVADYDTEKALKQGLKVNAQSTLVVFRGQKETSRVVGETTAPALRAALKSAL